MNDTTDSSKTRLILPCAGYGTRVGMAPDKSKELLEYEGKPLIEWHLDIANRYNLAPLVITRKEKIDLIEYCELKGIETLIIEVEGEWPDTVLKSESRWHDKNILMLPDTRFESTRAVHYLQYYLDYFDYTIATHKVTDISKWGHITDQGILYEKPPYNNTGYAWGIIGFKREFGRRLFQACSYKLGFWLSNFYTIQLDWFKDLTRERKSLTSSTNSEIMK